MFSAIIEEDNQNVKAYSGLARAKLALEDIDGAEAVLNGVPAEISIVQTSKPSLLKLL